MSEKVLISRSTMEDIGDALREVTEGTAQYLPSQMPGAIRSLGGSKVSPETIAPEFDPAVVYDARDIVFYNNALYKFTSSHFGEWTGTDAELTTVSEEITELNTMLPFSVPVTLTVSGWVNESQTVTVSGVLADETAQLIQPVPAQSSRTDYNEAGVEATAQAANSLTFTCTAVPSVSLSVYVVITPLAG